LQQSSQIFGFRHRFAGKIQKRDQTLAGRDVRDGMPLVRQMSFHCAPFANFSQAGVFVPLAHAGRRNSSELAA
jgi:hypothetical protein